MEATPQTKTETENPQTTQTQEFTQAPPAPPEPPTPEPTQTMPTPPTPPPPQSTHSKQNRRHALPAVLMIVLLATSFASAASIYSVYTLNVEVTSMQSQIETLSSAVADSQDGTAVTTISDGTSTSLSALYAEVEDSVVTIECTIAQYSNNPFSRQTTSTAQGSGFVYQYQGQMVIITNNHVIEDATAITVTFADGDTYTATVLGADASTDLAVLKADAPTSEYHPLEIVSSSTLSVGDAVVAIGSPYGLAGTMTTGIVSALDRTITITESMTSSYDITGLIQTSAPINSGNSGGPLMTYDGRVVGITTAIVSDSDGLGFAVPSDTMLRVIGSLIA